MFDGAHNQQGYHLDMFCKSLDSIDNRGIFKQNTNAYLDRYPMATRNDQLLTVETGLACYTWVAIFLTRSEGIMLLFMRGVMNEKVNVVHHFIACRRRIQLVYYWCWKIREKSCNLERLKQP